MTIVLCLNAPFTNVETWMPALDHAFPEYKRRVQICGVRQLRPRRFVTGLTSESDIRAGSKDLSQSLCLGEVMVVPVSESEGDRSPLGHLVNCTVLVTSWLRRDLRPGFEQNTLSPHQSASFYCKSFYCKSGKTISSRECLQVYRMLCAGGYYR